MTRRSPLLVLLSLTVLTGCAQYQYFVNEPLEGVSGGTGIAMESDRSPELLLVLAFSGGGTRAAALAYGVLETLDRVAYTFEGERRSLVDEVDVISSVSGGSFTAAYFALYGRRIFDDFERRFLRRNVTLGLGTRLLFPYNWLRLFSPRFNRSDLAAEYYDRILFDGKRFGDQLPGGPLVHIQATDLIEGTSFGFTEAQFAPICSDVSTYPISRAVAASAAVPVLLSPITLHNYAGTCGFEPPEWMRRAIEERDLTRRRFHSARRLLAYLKSKRSYIHLIDGGIADNLGIRGPIEVMTLQGGFTGALAQPGLARTRRVVFLLVNAQTAPDTSWGLVDVSPGIAQILDAVTSVQINNYNLETIEFLRRSIEAWDLEQRVSRSNGQGKRIEFYAVEVSFEALHDEAERRFLSSLPTSLSLGDDTIDRLRIAADRVLRESGEFQRLLRDLEAELR